MPFVFIYLLKVSVSLAVVFTFYHFVLRKLTFYNWNRYYLLGYSLLAFFIAFADISPVLEQQQWEKSEMVQWVPVIHSVAASDKGVATPQNFSAWQWLGLVIGFGMLFMLVRLFIQWLSFRRMVRKAKLVEMGGIPGTKMKLYQVEEDIIPFSFGNAIFINHRLHTKEELQEIVWHEFIHVKQKHSFDIIAGELICLLNWYNPFAWLIRRSIRQNLEFIADDKVLENGVDRKEYQYLLLKVIGNKHFSIAPKFNFSSLKKRIAMMNKMKSAGVHIVKFLFILPLIAVLLVAFRQAQINQDPTPESTELKPAKAPRIDTVPSVTTANSKGYYIDVIGVDGECTVVVKDKKGTEVKRVILNEWKAQKKYEDQYGEILLPPAPPTPPADVSAPVQPGRPVDPARPLTVTVPGLPFLTECPVTIMAPPSPVAVGQGASSTLARISKEWEITDKKAEIKLIDGKIEKYDLTDSRQKADFEKKYGKLININTNVNANVNTNVATTVATGINSNVNTVISIPPSAASGNSYITTTDGPVTIAGGTNAISTTAPMPAGMATVRDPLDHVITGKEDIVVKITRHTTREELDKFIAQMKEKGVNMEFDLIEFNDKGKLVRLHGHMRSGGSHSNFVADDFEFIMLAMIKKGTQVYFKVGTKGRETV